MAAGRIRGLAQDPRAAASAARLAPGHDVLALPTSTIQGAARPQAALALQACPLELQWALDVQRHKGDLIPLVPGSRGLSPGTDGAL